MRTLKIHLIRHGATDANKKGLYIGCKTDMPLSPEGMNELIEMVKEHNFVPVVDDRECFVGIILRRDILNFLFNFYSQGKGEI